jgi:hypothetical protein
MNKNAIKAPKKAATTERKLGICLDDKQRKNPPAENRNKS